MDEAEVVPILACVVLDERYIVAREEWLVKNVYRRVRDIAINLAEKFEGVRAPTESEIAEASGVSIEIVRKALELLRVDLEECRVNAARLTYNRREYGWLAESIVNSECKYAKSFVSWIEDQRDRFTEISGTNKLLTPAEMKAQRYSDLHGEGHKAFQKTLRKYKPESLMPFRPYARAIVRNDVRRAVNGDMPKSLSKFLGDVSKAATALLQELGQEPSRERIAEYLSQPLAPVSAADVSGALALLEYIRPEQYPQSNADAGSVQPSESLESVGDGNAHDTHIDAPDDDDTGDDVQGIQLAAPDAGIGHVSPEWLRRATERLGADFKTVAEIYFDGRTTKEIAAAEGVERGTIRQRQKRAMDTFFCAIIEELLAQAPEIAVLKAHYQSGAYRADLANHPIMRPRCGRCDDCWRWSTRPASARGTSLGTIWCSRTTSTSSWQRDTWVRLACSTLRWRTLPSSSLRCRRSCRRSRGRFPARRFPARRPSCGTPSRRRRCWNCGLSVQADWRGRVAGRRSLS
jgi:RNA polymerase sigma factor (sigma-70 family)